MPREAPARKGRQEAPFWPLASKTKRATCRPGAADADDADDGARQGLGARAQVGARAMPPWPALPGPAPRSGSRRPARIAASSIRRPATHSARDRRKICKATHGPGNLPNRKSRSSGQNHARLTPGPRGWLSRVFVSLSPTRAPTPAGPGRWQVGADGSQ